MSLEITPEQKAQLATWVGQRDAILLEISNLRVAKEGLEKTNKELGVSNTEIIAQINTTKGKIEELKNKEIELVTLQSKELSQLNSDRVRLESDIENFNKIVELLSKEKKSLEGDVAFLTDVFRKIDGQISQLDKIVDHVSRVSIDSNHEVETFVINLKKSLGDLIDVNTKNVFETNVVIDKLPRMLVEAQKHGLIKNKI